MKPMMRRAALFAPLAVLLAAGAALAAGPTVKIEKKGGVGTYLADAKGMTLYTFKKDMPGMSHCEGPCVDNWPIYFAEKVEAGAGIKAGDFATITRGDGKKQTTYKGMPLYYFVGDKAAGDANGQGKKDVWYAATP